MTGQSRVHSVSRFESVRNNWCVSKVQDEHVPRGVVAHATNSIVDTTIQITADSPQTESCMQHGINRGIKQDKVSPRLSGRRRPRGTFAAAGHCGAGAPRGLPLGLGPWRRGVQNADRHLSRVSRYTYVWVVLAVQP